MQVGMQKSKNMHEYVCRLLWYQHEAASGPGDIPLDGRVAVDREAHGLWQHG